MDELIRHVVEQMAIDGSPGNTLDEFENHVRSFVDQQYEKQRKEEELADPDEANGGDALPKQVIDQAFLGFIWKRLARLPHVKVGTHVPRAVIEAAAAEAAAELKARNQKLEEEGKPVPKEKKKDTDYCTVFMDTVQVDEAAKALSLSELDSRFGDELRIVIDEVARKEILVGPGHVSLSPTAWTVFQLVIRTRQDGIPIPELVRISGLDTKAAFYQLTKILGARGLVVLVKQIVTKGLANVAIPRRFCHLNEAWISTQRMNLELKQLKGQNDGDEGGADDDEAGGAADDGGMQDAAEGAQAVREAASTSTLVTDANGLLTFSQPIPSHVAPEAVARIRLLRLLQHSLNNVTPLKSIWERIGLDLSRRKSIAHYINMMEDDSLVERVKVQPDADAKPINCLRLTEKGMTALDAAKASGPKSLDLDGTRAERLRSMLTAIGPGVFCGEVVWERQFAEYIANKGMEGATVDDVAVDFGLTGRGKRYVDSTITTLQELSHPAFADLDVKRELEQKGRMRSYRYHSRQAFIHRGLTRPELGLEDEAMDAIPKNPDALRNFVSLEGDQTWTRESELEQRMADLAQITLLRSGLLGDGDASDDGAKSSKSKKGASTSKGKAAMKKRPTSAPKAKPKAARQSAQGDEDGEAEAARKAPAKAKKHKNPIDPVTGKRKRGRPPRQANVQDAEQTTAEAEGDAAVSAEASQAGPSAATQGGDEATAAGATPARKAKRSKVQKQAVEDSAGDEQQEDAARPSADVTAADAVPPTPASRKRGRAGKEPEAGDTQQEETGDVAAAPPTDAEPQPKRKKGRSRKTAQPEEVEQEAADSWTQEAAPQVADSADTQPSQPPTADAAADTGCSQRKSSRQRTKTAKLLELESAARTSGRALGGESSQAGGATPAVSPGIALKPRAVQRVVQAETPSSPAVATPSPSAHPTPREQPSIPRHAGPGAYFTHVKAASKEKKTDSPSRPKINIAMRRRQVSFAQFMEERQVIDMSDAPHEFSKWVKERDGDEAAAAMSISDSRTRRSIIEQLIAEGKIKEATVSQLSSSSWKGKKPGLGRKHTIVFVPDLDAEELQDYCRRVQLGEEGNIWKRKDVPKPRKAKTDLGTLDIGLKGGAYKLRRKKRGHQRKLKRDYFEPQKLDRLSLDQLLSDATRGAVLYKASAIRQLMGVPKGDIARLRVLHEELFQRAIEAQGQEHGTVDVVQMIFDMPFARYICFAPPRKTSDVLVRAWDDESNRDVPVRNLRPAVLRALGLKKDDERLPLRLEDRLRCLGWLGLLSVEDAASDYSRYVVRLEMNVGQLGFDKDLYPNNRPSPESFTSVDDVKEYWVSLRQYSRGLPRYHKPKIFEDKVVGEAEKEMRKELYNALRDTKEWRTASKSVITLGQAALIQRIADVCQDGDRLNDADVAKRLVHVTALPASVLIRFLEMHCQVEIPSDHALMSLVPQDEILHDAHEEAAALRRIGSKAQVARKKRGAKWESMMSDVFTFHKLNRQQRHECRAVLKPFKKKYIRQPEVMTDMDLERHIATGIVKVIKPRKMPSEKRADKAPAGKKKRDAKSKDDAKEGEEGEPGGRRKRNTGQRIKWDREQEELLRDACIILRSRDKERDRQRGRPSLRRNWVALSQIWPNSQVAASHFDTLEQKIGEKAYLEQLEKEWTQLWSEFRGTRWLRDDNWPHHSNFQLREHIDFLRSRIDKNKVLDTVEKAGIEPLPADMGVLLSDWKYDKAPPVDAARMWDVLFNGEIEASSTTKIVLLKENSFAMPWQPQSLARTEEEPDADATEAKPSNDSLAKAEVVVRMVLASAKDVRTHSGDAVDRFVELNGGEAVGEATGRLSSQGVVNTPDKVRYPGVNVTYSEKTKSCLAENLLVKDDFAKAIDEQKQKLESGEEGDYLLVDPNGDELQAAALLELICEGKVEVDPHIEGLMPLRDDLFVNVKKMNDDETEMALGFKINKDSAPSSSRAGTGDVSAMPPLAPAALDKSEAVITRAWTAAIKKDGDLGVLRDRLLEAGSAGLPIKEIRDDVFSDLGPTRTAELVDAVLDASKPLALSAGYDVPRIVHARFAYDLTVEILPLPAKKGSKPPSKSSQTNAPKRVLPSAFVDIYGQIDQDRWDSAVRVVVGWARNRPGMLQSQLANALFMALHRPDVIDVVDAACEAGLVKRVYCGSGGGDAEAQLRLAEDDEIGIELA